MERKSLEKIVLKTIKEITSISKLSLDTNVNEDIYIDSITWVQIIEQIEEKIGQFTDLEALFTESLDVNTLKDMIDLIERYQS